MLPISSSYSFLAHFASVQYNVVGVVELDDCCSSAFSRYRAKESILYSHFADKYAARKAIAPPKNPISTGVC